MQPEALHNFLFELYDYADFVAGQIKPDNRDNAVLFLTLVYIEDIMDTYGRGLIRESARQTNNPEIDPSTQLKEAHRRIDLLRAKMNELNKQYDFDNTLKQAGERMYRNWHKHGV